ncbi:hypothetical protein HGRIS_012088 [Hohenbuehelia grisea]|uniref:Uncharacterized protein n=1 Tax=Hohenbuehelia grisea TaxID=104357 RepID=A0ABR3IR67_9AGAR
MGKLAKKINGAKKASTRVKKMQQADALAKLPPSPPDLPPAPAVSGDGIGSWTCTCYEYCRRSEWEEAHPGQEFYATEGRRLIVPNRQALKPVNKVAVKSQITSGNGTSAPRRWRAGPWNAPSSHTYSAAEVDDRDASEVIPEGDGEHEESGIWEEVVMQPRTHEVGLLEIALPAKAKGVSKDFEVVQTPGRVTALEDEDDEESLDDDGNEWEDLGMDIPGKGRLLYSVALKGEGG